MAFRAADELAVRVGGELSAPSVTPWYNFTHSPISVVSPITTPVP